MNAHLKRVYKAPAGLFRCPEGMEEGSTIRLGLSVTEGNYGVGFGENPSIGRAVRLVTHFCILNRRADRHIYSGEQSISSLAWGEKLSLAINMRLF